MGYENETKGYRLYDPNQGKVFHNHDVMFNESEKEKETEINTDPVHLDFSNNCETITDSEDCTTEERTAKPVSRRSE